MTWEKRNTVSSERVAELVSLYKELGFEVKVELYDNQNASVIECKECFSDGKDYFVIYTKRFGNKIKDMK
jgi:hypothetical protein